MAHRECDRLAGAALVQVPRAWVRLVNSQGEKKPAVIFCGRRGEWRVRDVSLLESHGAMTIKFKRACACLETLVKTIESR